MGETFERMALIRRIEADDSFLNFCDNVQESVGALGLGVEVRDPRNVDPQRRPAFGILSGVVGGLFLQQQSFSRSHMLKQLQRDVPSLSTPIDLRIIGVERLPKVIDTYFTLVTAGDFVATERLAVVTSMQNANEADEPFDFQAMLGEKPSATIAYKKHINAETAGTVKKTIRRCIPVGGLMIQCQPAIPPLSADC